MLRNKVLFFPFFFPQELKEEEEKFQYLRCMSLQETRVLIKLKKEEEEFLNQCYQ